MIRVQLKRLRTYHCAVANLKRFDKMEESLSTLPAEDDATAVFGGAVDLESAEDGCHGRCRIGQDTSQTHVVGLPRHFLEAEGLADSLLE